MKHVLVIRLSALGDVAIMAPVLYGYAEGNPDMTFTVAGPPMLEPLFMGRDNVRFLGLKKRQSFLKIFKTLESVGADTVLDLHKVNRVGMALIVMRMRHLLNLHFRVFSLRKGRLSRWLFLHHWKETPRKPQYERYDDVFRRAGLKAVSKGESFFLQVKDHSPQSGEWPAIGVAPFSQHEGKVWPWENVERLVSMLATKGYRVILFGSKEEARILDALADREEGVMSVAGRQTFAEELKIIGGLALMVSMDSANMHFASVMGVPVVSIWGATHPSFGFYGYGQVPENALCANLRCQPCSAYGEKRCRLGDYRCMRAITPEMVFDKVSSLVSIVRSEAVSNV